MTNKYFLLIMIMLSSASCRQNDSFTLSGDLQGLKAGDTLLFEAYEPAFYTPTSQDTLIIENNNTFRFTIPAQHTTFGYLEYIPQNGKELSNNSAEIVARPGDNIRISGYVDYLNTSTYDGGFYDNPSIARYLDTTKESDSLEILYTRKIIHFSETGNNDSTQFYIRKYRKIKRPEEYKKQRDSLMNFADNEYAAYMYLRGMYRKTSDELQERLKRFSPTTRKTHFGQSLEAILPILNNIDEGKIPKDFTLIDKNGNTVTLSDYRGKYLLIFYYGVCGGVFQTDPHLTDIYNEYHDKGFEILGLCRDGDIALKYPQLLKSVEVQRLLAHPYTTIYLTDKQNEFIKKELYLYATPTVMLIDPEGTTLIRGGHKEEAIRKVLGKNL